MFVRRRHALITLVAAALLTSGCGSPASPPIPETTAAAPSPTDSASAAFAAAEATYRAYVDALNAVDLADPTTFEPVYALTTGEVQEADRRNLTRYHDNGVILNGSSVIASTTYDTRSQSLHACLDVSAVNLTAPDGSSLVDPDRLPVQSLVISFDDAVSRIVRIEAKEANEC
ncbi:hypothetical protein ABC195_11980 [Microbacterium sp. 2P01SA-2]|uniref:hypothetical protein n=1 Tax=unclassified Microbacterium TaxID=2609290 RepID=UPI0039A2F3BF